MNQRFSTLFRPLLLVASCSTLALVISAATVRAADSAGNEAGFKPIFNGKSLDGWQADPKYWSVHEGAIVGERIKDNSSERAQTCVWRQGSLDDFALRFSCRVTGGDEAAGFRSPVLFKPDPTHGVVDPRAGAHPLGTDVKIASAPFPPELRKAVREHEWNDFEYVVQGQKRVLRINGQELASDWKRPASEFVFAFEPLGDASGKVEFKNIRLKRLKLADGRKKVVMVAGTPSHGPGEHEFNAGTQLLKKCLDENAPQVLAVAYLNGWPDDPTAYDNADAIMFYMDGGGGHPVIQKDRLKELDRLTKQGVGIICAHYAVEVPKDKGGAEFERWIGGYFETFWSINPTWHMSKPTLAKGHPITRGVKPFDIDDEWYYHMRFPENMEGITPILSAVPPDNTHNGGDGPYSGNKYVRARKGMTEVLSWAIERPDGGRGYGFTGGHYHHNWANDDYRKLMLNAIVWVAKAEVPPDGVNSKVTHEDLQAHLDHK
jgi:type 1 glutamine amidotransferase